MGRNWQPKYAVVCVKCGWKGKRTGPGPACPKCKTWNSVKLKPKETA